MRNVIIKRNKSFVGCLAKLKVYIEDYTYGETKIGGVPCRKLGTLKNGEEKAFLIPDNAAKIYVIADSLSKNFCNEFYNLPEGQYDIYLSGQCRYNPASGNAFRFDGITDESVLKNRKKGTKIGIVVLIIAVIVGFIIGFIPSFVNNDGDAKQFRCEEMQITLTDEFMKVPVADFDACFANEDIVVLVIRDDFSVMDGLENYTLQEYGELSLEVNELADVSEVKQNNGIMYYDYEAENTEENNTYYYYATIFKSEDAFWTIQFAVLTEEVEQYMPQIIEYSETITFNE
ncbi:MAG: hypothetical protein J6B37_02075 [Clostridia bacterium]|nr:hypothetical protein [Clostridia bacterium]